MRLALRHSGATKSATKMHFRHGGSNHDVIRGWVRQGGALKQFFASIGGGGSSVTVDNPSVSGAASSSSSVPVTSREASVSVSGGVAPYTYAWAQLSGTTMTATNATAATSAFTATVAPGDQAFGIWQCTVTDAAGTTGTVSVNVALNNIGGTL